MIIMSSNQWKCDRNLPDWAARGEDCSAEGRVGGLTRAYQRVTPDILGIQEASVHMTNLLMQRMACYEHEGQAVHYELITGGDTPILYRADKLLLIESGFLRYDERIPGLEGSFNNVGTKSYTFGVFEEKSSGRRIALMSTHLWWMSSDPASKEYQPHSDEARAHQIKLALKRLEEVTAQYRCPGVLVGDLNAVMDSPCLRAARDMGWIEAHDCARGLRSDTRGHHPCYADGYSRPDEGVFAQAIDHILVKDGSPIVVGDYLRVDDTWFDCISDHYPVYISLEFAD